MTGLGGPFGLDFTSVMMIGAARHADLNFLADVLPACEAAILMGRIGGEAETEG